MPETGVKEGGDCGQFFSRQSTVGSQQSTVSSQQSESPEVRKNLAESR